MNKFFRNHWSSKMTSIVLAVLLLNLSGCSYYKVRPVVATTTQSVKEQQDLNKVMFLHHGENVWNFKNSAVDGTVVTGELEEITDLERFELPDPYRTNRYRPKNNPEEIGLINEVHIYISEYSNIDGGRIAIAPGAIERIDVYEKDKTATTFSWIFTGIMIGTGAFILILLIALLIKSSCPFIYVWNGEYYEFTGEIYSGAIQPALERNDYLTLPHIIPEDDTYKIKMSNEVREIQYTNFTELIVFDHPATYSVLIDKYGDHHTISNTIEPITATNFNGKNILNYVSEKDSLNYFGDEIEKDQATTDGIIMKFDVPPDAVSAKLVINAKNSLWLDYLFTRFHQMFGESYDKFQTKQKDLTPGELNKWYIEQDIPLSLYVENNGNWEPVDYFNLVGPMAFKEDVIEFNIPEGAGEELTLKLESGYLFWEIDFVGIDLSADKEVNYIVIPVSESIDNNGEDVRVKLQKDDNEYYVQTNVGDEVVLNFPVPEFTDESQTVILHSKGYYTILRYLEGKANKKVLKEFKNSGKLSEYSIEIFNEFRNSKTNQIQSPAPKK